MRFEGIYFSTACISKWRLSERSRFTLRALGLQAKSEYTNHFRCSLLDQMSRFDRIAPEHAQRLLVNSVSALQPCTKVGLSFRLGSFVAKLPSAFSDSFAFAQPT